MAYREMWEIEVRHEELNKYRHIRGSDRYVVNQKATAQQKVWDEMWEKRKAADKKKQAADKKKQDRTVTIRSKEDKKALAITKTHEAQDSINQLESTLAHALSIDNAIDWFLLLNKKQFPDKKPTKPNLTPIPKEPYAKDIKYQPNLGIFDKILSSSRIKKEKAAVDQYQTDHTSWSQKKKKIEDKNRKTEHDYSNNLTAWQKRKDKYEAKQKQDNNKILEKKEEYLQKNTGTVADYCEMVLTNSEYPEYFPQEWDIDYQAESQILIVDYSLPDIDFLPTTKNVKYVISREEFTETHLSNAALNKLYDGLLYQITLRTIHELYEADVINALDSIVFNGWVDSVDKATGQNANSCIMSLQASKDEFLAINLAKVDSKACFKQLKGVGSSKLHGLSPVAPIISIDKEDHRFISAYAVLDEMDNSDNLAAMDWQDFENLIREVFEKEFVSSGGEVKITQASRDGGVDAVAFDPDPIRGGKIVIQAKRYTNVVGVSAVRDLFGTTVNEGATKGILVTTADYGPDAYEFAKGKPLTLLNGGNLLHLLENMAIKQRLILTKRSKS